MESQSSQLTFVNQKTSTPAVLFAAAAGLMMTALSILGLTFSRTFYPSVVLRENNLPNDPVNLLIGLPLFLAALILIRKGKLLGRLLLQGALIYVIYNYLGYAFGRLFDFYAVCYFGLVILGLIALVVLLKEIDHQSVMKQLQEKIGRKFSGWILVVFGLAFIALAVSTIAAGVEQGTIPPLGEAAVSVADIVVSLGWVVGGIALLRKKPLGYTTGLGLLVAASSLFIGLVLFFFFAPLVSARPFDWEEVITVFGMGLICFVPTGIYWRGVVKSDSMITS